jgi:hypothetical protein
MSRPEYWIIENYDYRPCKPSRAEFRSAVALHTHSYHSEESLGSLEWIMEMPVLRWFNNIFKRAFREKAKEELNYGDLYYCPLVSPLEVYELERKSAEAFVTEKFLLAITDHNKIAACQELLEARPDLAPVLAISEELSIFFEEEEFHLGVIGIPTEHADEHHKILQEYGPKGHIGSLFDYLTALKPQPLVILNHPFYQLDTAPEHGPRLLRLLRKYGSYVHAMEFNGLRPRKENDATLDLAWQFRKPVVGGGDRHASIASLALAVSREAETMNDFIEEVKGGTGVSILKNDYFFPHSWKIFVRILQYVQYYRRITFYKGVPITDYPIDERIIPDYFADAAGMILKVLKWFRLVR